MQKVSDNYKKYIKENLALSPKSKIIVDGVEYLGDVIKTSPKFSHSNKTFIGGFPTKTVDFEMYNFDDSIDFEDKEIEIYKGYVINGTIEYVKQGIFIPRADDIETNISSKTISFKDVEDKTQLLQDTYESKLDWNVKHTGLEIVLEICDKKNIKLETTNFKFANYLFKQPNISAKTTNREVISRIAEIGGEIAIFNNNGNLAIKGQTPTGDIIERKRYKTLSKEKKYEPNLLVIGNEGYDNDIMFPYPKPKDSIELKIEDNPFTDLYREEMIEDVSKHILNLSYIPFTMTEFVDGFYYELNDIITVLDKNGQEFNAVILDISNSSRIKSNVKAPVKEESLSNYNLAGSNKQSINEVKFQVDHINNEIISLVSETSEYNNKITNITQTVDQIKSELKNVPTITTENEGTGTLLLQNLMNSRLIYLNIHPTSKDILGLFASTQLKASPNLKSLSRKIWFEGNTNFSYLLPNNLYFYSETIYDEFIFDGAEKQIYIIHRVGIDNEGNKYELEEEIKESFEYYDYFIGNGDYKIYMPSYPSAYISIKAMIKNDYTTQFATKLE